MTVPFQVNDVLSLWSLSDEVFLAGQPFSATQFPALLVPGETYLVLTVAFDGPSNGKIIVTGAAEAKTCAVIAAQDIEPYVDPCSAKPPPPPITGQTDFTDQAALFADFSSLRLDGPTIWVQGPDAAYGPIGLWADDDSAIDGVAASGPVGQMYWLFEVTAASFWIGGDPLGSAPTNPGGTVPGLLGLPFYLTIPVNF